ncbi:RidA family protein [Ruminococcaceae bacterium OttesenSCG-928-D13]|nr:RidA family protein [Ruminococcaceae bacterium OttesenSCG-928-D13]
MAAKNEIIRTGGNGRRSTCTAHGGLVYVSGITTVLLEADITGQTQDVLNQIDRLLAANGSNKTRVLSADITLADMADYGNFNAAWDQWVSDDNEPARRVAGGQLALSEYRVKISLVAAQS